MTEGRDYLHGIPGTFHAALCARCDLWFQNPRPMLARIPDLYPAEYLPHEALASDDEVRPMSAGERRYLRRHLGYTHLEVANGPAFAPWHRWTTGVRLVPRFVPDGTLLEVGCGSGNRLRELRRLGWTDLCGIELVAPAAAHAQDAGFSVQCGPVEQLLAAHPDRSMDVVIASMVLEHMTDPFGFLRMAGRKLKEGGEFLFSTIVRDALDARVYGSYWAGFDFPRHLVYLTSRDIGRAMEEQFTKVQEARHVSPVDWVRSSSWRGRDHCGRWYDPLFVALGSSAPMKVAHLPLAALRQTCRVSFRCRLMAFQVTWK